MRSRKLRIASVFVSFVAALALTGLLMPGASAAEGDLQVALVNQPADAGVGDLITAEPFDPTSGYIQVHVTHTVNVCDPECHLVDQDLQNADVSFSLLLGGVDASDSLSVDTRTTNADGNATFEPLVGSLNPLSIDSANDFLSEHYQLVPEATFGETTAVGTASDAFDIWEDGCHGTGCNVKLRSNLETYTAQGNFGLAASQLSANLLTCPDQRVIFSGKTFFHVTTGDESEVVLLVTHITRADMKAAANNGQKHVGWCIGLESSTPWTHNGASFTTQVVGGKTFYVAMAPKCPNKRTATQFAPCIVSQMGDNDGGSFIRGYVLGGDPPRRT
jgi:hypothetical protein